MHLEIRGNGEGYSKCVSSLFVQGCTGFHSVIAHSKIKVAPFAPREMNPHEDGPLFYPTITTISLGGPCQLNLYRPHTPLQNHNEEQATGTENGEQNGEQESNNLEYDLEARYVGSLLLEARSLLVLQEDLYTTFLHGIEETKQDVVTNKILNLESCTANVGETVERSTRISLTIRHVPRVIKAKLLLGKSRR
ncbi:alpha-ketoglutarate-dependent dioxygenase alkB homolog 6-like [Penaeus indicus]|uniref:alpha-ketoglutarate-dependent dioxygenase alkB homolog 6-like n=1 Tax=Penaeus indicus TaxID=29960 RepID=UPI00300D562E